MPLKGTKGIIRCTINLPFPNNIYVKLDYFRWEIKK
jgi:hypothetical protein